MRGSTARAVVWAGLTLLVGIVVWKAWVTDDAYITFRTAQHFVEGRGLVWNAGERVQVYTHPLWMFLVSGAYALTREFFYTSIVLGVACTLAAAWLLATRVASSWHAALAGLLVLTSSRAFTDFSTAGLENPLTHLLLVLLLVTRRAVAFSALAGLCLLTRLDLAPLVLPAWLWVLWSARARPRVALAAAAAGIGPAAAWEAFSLLYYGAPFPNTAYAKLNTGIPAAELAAQGLAYLRNSLLLDPPTLIAVGAGLAVGLAARRTGEDPGGATPLSAPPRVWAVGLALSLAYVVRVGGDFMSGRFLTPALCVAVGLLVSRSLPRRPALAVAAIAGVLLALPATTPFVDRSYGDAWHAAIDRHGIADERSFYDGRADLWSSWRHGEKWPDPKAFEEARWLRRHWPADWFADDLLHVGTITPADGWPPLGPIAPDGRPYDMVVVRGAVGFLGFHLGPDVHVVDYHAIGDPLLARLPMTRPDPISAGLLPKLGDRGWRVGHYYRRLPTGYVETLATGRNVIRDPALREYYDVLRRITHGPVLDGERLATIARFQLGAYDHLLREKAPP